MSVEIHFVSDEDLDAAVAAYEREVPHTRQKRELMRAAISALIGRGWKTPEDVQSQPAMISRAAAIKCCQDEIARSSQLSKVGLGLFKANAEMCKGIELIDSGRADSVSRILKAIGELK